MEKLTENDTMTFGKYKGTKITEILTYDVDYLEWLIDNTDTTNFSAAFMMDIAEKRDEDPMNWGMVDITDLY